MKKFVPDDVVQSGSGFKKKEEATIMSLLLRLAKANGYDEEGRIRDGNGIVVPDSNVARLVAYVCRPEPFIPGVPEFHALLRKIGVDDLPNQNVRGSPPPPPPPASSCRPSVETPPRPDVTDSPERSLPPTGLPPPPPLVRMEYSPPPRIRSAHSPPPPLVRMVHSPPPSSEVDGRDVPLPSGDEGDELEWEDMKAAPQPKRSWTAVEDATEGGRGKLLKKGMQKRRSKRRR